MATNSSNRTARLLSVLHHFDVERRNARHFQDTPKGASSASLMDLIEAKLIDEVSQTARGKKLYAISTKGKAVLASPDPAGGLPEFVSWWDRLPEDQQARMNEQTVVFHQASARTGNTLLATPVWPNVSPKSSSSDRSSNGRSANLVYPPRGLSRADAARYIGISTSKFDEMVRDGRMPHPKRIDARGLPPEKWPSLR